MFRKILKKWWAILFLAGGFVHAETIYPNATALAVVTPFPFQELALQTATPGAQRGYWDNLNQIHFYNTTSGTNTPTPNPTVATNPVTALGTTAQAIQNWQGQSVKSYPFNATGNGSTDDTAAIQAAVSNGGDIYIPKGTYVISAPISITQSNVHIHGGGIGNTTLIAKSVGTGVNTLVDLFSVCNGAITAAPASPVSLISIEDMTLDGNRSNSQAATIDVYGWGVLTNNASYCSYKNLQIQNCWTGGFGNDLDSNFCTGNNIQINNCGHSVTAYSGDPTTGYPGFDINASQYCSFLNVVTNGGSAGSRLLNNCYGDYLQVNSYNPQSNGFVMQSNLNSGANCFNNIVEATINSGCAYQGADIGPATWNNHFIFNITGVTGNAIVEAGGNTFSPISGNTYEINSAYCGQASAQIGGNGGTWTVDSYYDGAQVTPGAAYAVQVSGQSNNIKLTMIQPTTTPVLRGVIFQATASVNNNLSSFVANNCVSPFTDNGVNDTYTYSSGGTVVSGNDWYIKNLLGIGAVNPSSSFPLWAQLSNSSNSWLGLKNTGAGGSGLWLDGGPSAQSTVQFLVNGTAYGSIVGSQYNLLFYGASGNLDGLLEIDDNWHFTNGTYATFGDYSAGVSALSYSVGSTPTPGASGTNSEGDVINGGLVTSIYMTPTPNPTTSTSAVTALGSTSQAVQQWVWASVKQYPFSAYGDNSHNDTAAINACINYVGSLGGGTVFFPRGTYLVSSSPNYGVTIGYNNITLQGEGRDGVTIKNTSTSTGNVLYAGQGNFPPNPGATQISGVIVKDLTVDGNDVSQIATATVTPPATDTSGNGINLNYVSNSRVLNCRVQNCFYQGIVFQGGSSTAKNNLCDGNIVTAVGEIGIGFEGGIFNSIMTNNLIHDLQALATTPYGGVGIENSNIGITGGNNIISNNQIYNIPCDGIASQDNSDFSVIDNNVIESVGTSLTGSAIDVYANIISPGHLEIVGNQIKGGSTSAQAAIRILSSSVTIGFNNIVDNLISNCVGGGIQINYGVGNSISGNLIHNVGTGSGSIDSAIRVSGGAVTTSIRNNYINSVTGNGIENLSGSSNTDIEGNYLNNITGTDISDAGSSTRINNYSLASSAQTITGNLTVGSSLGLGLSPSYPLDVLGDAHFQRSGGSQLFLQGVSGGFRMVFENSSSGSVPVYFDGGGDVNINTSNSDIGYQLGVGGSIAGTSFAVGATPTPGYSGSVTININPSGTATPSVFKFNGGLITGHTP